jgi:DNA ligase D-like protein (predicted 3'-phosphoesterase)
MTEDHPYEYAFFEGIIPEGSYGAGTVDIWDKGTYSNLRKEHGKEVSLKKSIRDGKIEIVLHGRKIHGSYVLIRLGMGNNWILMKMHESKM